MGGLWASVSCWQKHHSTSETHILLIPLRRAAMNFKGSAGPVSGPPSPPVWALCQYSEGKYLVPLSLSLLSSIYNWNTSAHAHPVAQRGHSFAGFLTLSLISVNPLLPRWRKINYKWLGFCGKFKFFLCVWSKMIARLWEETVKKHPYRLEI